MTDGDGADEKWYMFTVSEKERIGRHIKGSISATRN